MKSRKLVQFPIPGRAETNVAQWIQKLFNQECSNLWEDLWTNSCSLGSITFWFWWECQSLSGFPNTIGNIKLSPKKSDMYTRSITWCGRRNHEIGMSYESHCIRGLLDLPAPLNAAEIENFLDEECDSRLYERHLPLQELLKAVQERCRVPKLQSSQDLSWDVI